MTREEAKKLLPIIQEFVEGKEVEYYDYNDDDWIKTDTPIWESKVNYRIKSKPKYRPFKNKEECWNEMLKHQPFGWTKLIGEIGYSLITDVDDEILYSDAFKECTFADGTPFGIKEE